MHSKAARQLTKRDRDILQWIGQAGIASRDQLARRFWAGKREQTALDRLRLLVGAGYLDMHVYDLRTPGELVFTLTEKGRMQFSSAWRESLQVGLPFAGEIKQQLLSQDAYLKIEAQVRQEGGSIVAWRSERDLRAQFRRAQVAARRNGRRLSPLLPVSDISPVPSVSSVEIPDAQVVIFTAHSNRIILDIEIDGFYYGNMLWEKAARLGRSEHRVLWVCTEQRAEYVQTAVANYPNITVLVV